MIRVKKLKMMIMLILLLAVCMGLGNINKFKSHTTVNVYTSRNYEADKIVYGAFEKKTGIKINIVQGKSSEILEKLKREGKDTDIDLFISTDITNLSKAIDSNLTQPIKSDKINKNVPKDLRGNDNEWIGLASRARAIAYDKNNITKEEIDSFIELGNEKWKGKILTRSSNSIYSKSLLASIIEYNGEEEAKVWANNIASNLAKKPDGNDIEQIKSIYKGEGQIAIVNSHYVGRMLNSVDEEERIAAQSIDVIIPKETSINISGMILSKYSKNSENAIKLVEFITDEKAQQAYADINYEYPVNKNVKPNDVLTSWGNVEIDNVDLIKIEKNNETAKKIFKQVGWE